MRRFLKCLVKYRNGVLLPHGVGGRVIVGIMFELISNLEVLFQILCKSCELHSLLIENLLLVLKLTLQLAYSQVPLSFSKYVDPVLVQCLQL